MESEITLESLAQRVAALEAAVSALTAKHQSEVASIDFSKIGGKKIDHFVPEKDCEPVDLSPAYGKTGRRIA